MQLEKKHLELLYKVLQGTEGVLTLSEGRKRDALMKPLVEFYNTFDQDKKKIYEKYAEKDKTVQAGEKTTYHFSKKNLPTVQKELAILSDETVEITAPQGMKEILERTQYKPLVGESESIDAIISKF